jgi:hypothetical protein
MKKKQINSTPLFQVESATTKAIKQSNDHADKVIPDWSELAMDGLRKYAAVVDNFITEEARRWLVGIVPEPPDNTAWGGVIVKAKNIGLIEPVEGVFRKTADKISHCRPSQVWTYRRNKL